MGRDDELIRAAPVALAGLALLAGCGGEAPEDEGGDDAVIVAALGDSITAGSPLWDPDPAVRAGIAAPDERSQFEYWAAKELGAVELRNCGAFGERTDEIARRLDECADGADVLVIQGGINDIAQGRPVAQAVAQLRSMTRRGQALGLSTFVVDVLPWNNGHPAADEPIADLNALIERLARRLSVPLIPFHDTLEDPAEPGLMAPALTDDGDHPSVAGYRLLGARLAAALGRQVRRAQD